MDIEIVNIFEGAQNSKQSWEDTYSDIFCGFFESSALIEPKNVA
jgi:hypothetical protein